jgi:hypothetical protein
MTLCLSGYGCTSMSSTSSRRSKRVGRIRDQTPSRRYPPSPLQRRRRTDAKGFGCGKGELEVTGWLGGREVLERDEAGTVRVQQRTGHHRPQGKPRTPGAIKGDGGGIPKRHAVRPRPRKVVDAHAGGAGPLLAPQEQGVGPADAGRRAHRAARRGPPLWPSRAREGRQRLRCCLGQACVRDANAHSVCWWR